MNERTEIQFDENVHFPLGNASRILRNHTDRDQGADAKWFFAGIPLRRQVPGYDGRIMSPRTPDLLPGTGIPRRIPTESGLSVGIGFRRYFRCRYCSW